MAKKKGQIEEPESGFDNPENSAATGELAKERVMSFRASEAFTERVRALCGKTGISYSRARAFLTDEVAAHLEGLDLRAFMIAKSFGDE